MANPTVSRAGALRIGTRGSPLALAQAHELRDRLCAAHPHLEPARIEIVPIQTTGDKVQNRTLAAIGGKGLFTQEIEDALAEGSLDMARSEERRVRNECVMTCRFRCSADHEKQKQSE